MARARDSDRDIEVPGKGQEAKDGTKSGEELNCLERGTEGSFWGQF